MSITYNSSIVLDDLVLFLDAANPKSYPGTGTLWKDLSGKGNDHTIIGAPSYTAGKFVLTDGMGFSKTTAITGLTTDVCTVVVVYSTTTSELWVRGNSDNSWYLSAAGLGGTYYHGNCGTPVNYVDNVISTSPIRNGAFHISEAKNVNFSAWTNFGWFLYPGEWFLTGSVQCIMIYNRPLSAAESSRNFSALRGRYSL